MPKLIIALAGTLGAGKGTASAYLKTKYGADIIMFSDVLRSILRTLALDVSREELQKLSLVLREAYGQDVISRAVRRALELSERPIVVLDGVRRIGDLSGISEMERFHMLFIDADPKLRHERIVSRAQNRGDSEKTLETFLQEELADADITIKPLAVQSQKIILNETTEADFYQAIDAFIASVR